MDCIETLLGANEVRHGGQRHSLGILLSGSDPVSLDAYGLKLLQKIEPKLANKKVNDIKHLNSAIKLNIGTKLYELIELNWFYGY